MEAPDDSVDVRMDESLGIDFSTRPQTLLMVLDSECPFCQDSMPFYRRLTGQDTPETQIVVIAPTSDTRIEEYLASEGVAPDAIVLTDNDRLPVPGTPTLLLADSNGVVTHSWVGRLGPDSETAVTEAVFR